MEDIFALLKPKGPTSHDMVDMVRKATGVKKVGHAGTLDPMAEGVLVIGVGRAATKKLGAIVEKEKEYVATITLGAVSSTDDAEGEVQTRDVQHTPDEKSIREALQTFTGQIQQVPPHFSAVKKGGKKAYEEARKGRVIELEPRDVEIKEIEILLYDWPTLQIRVVTGPGVYIRALARDLGEAMGTGAYLSALERTRVGDYTKESALTIEQLKESFHE